MTGNDMVGIKLKYLWVDKDRHGNTRAYVCVPNRKKVRLRQPMGSDAFLEEYKAAIEGRHPQTKQARKIVDGSFAWLCRTYYGSTDFRNKLGEETQNVRRRILNNVCDKIGDHGFAKVEQRHIKSWMDDRADRPEAANGLLKALSGLYRFAVGRSLIYQNPVVGISQIQTKTDGFHTWTDAEVDQFEARHPIGTKPRLALALLLFNGLRRSDVVGLGPQLRDGFHRVRQKKTGHILMLPILPVLAGIIEATAHGETTYLLTEYGKPFTAKGFGAKFRVWCDQAGLPHCSAHGLRKCGATRAAEAGASDRQLMAIFGWTKPEQASIYVKAAEQKRLASAMMGSLAGLKAEQNSSHRHSGESKTPDLSKKIKGRK